MEEIARLSGTSRSTVHAVLTGKPWVSQYTRRKVEETVSRFGYQPNRLARALGKRATHLVALILKDVMNPFNSLMVEGISGALSPGNYATLLMSTEDDHEREVQAVRAALSYQVDGIIMTPQQLGVDLGHLWGLREKGVPLVTFGALPGLPTSRVEADEREIGRIAGAYLCGLGHRRIVFLRGPASSAAAEERVAGFRDALSARGLPFSGDMVITAGATMKDGRRAAAHALQGTAPERPTALVCYNDLVAAGAYGAAEELGLSVPRDVSVIGIDGIELGTAFGPPLTTVAQPCVEMGRTMAEFLLSEIAAPAAGPERVKRFSPVLVERRSVREAG